MSQPSDHPLLVSVPHGAAPEYDPDERKILLQIAHESILSFSEGRQISFSPPSPHLAEPRGVFTTLYSDQKLRGCVGYPTAILPLYRAVAETARAAANDDPRFPAVSLPEARQLQISISVLSPLHTVLPDQIEIGIHGLVISQGTRRGLLLPQVPVENAWSREVFLEQTCMKAGLAPDAWRGGAHIEAFTAEVFADSGLAAGY
ncbi:MAG TPA: AmmeMemoRadiSam system protein A [Terriglobales bacterium]|jgi:AmmeMemoRadiSam system protein A|nr:AmmeMemoRadiSam system protein A [Terriglobales bacterium]